MSDLTLIEKIQREQQELAVDLERFLVSEKQTTSAELEAIQKKQSEIGDTIQKIVDKQEAE